MTAAGTARTQIPLTVAAFRRYLQQVMLAVSVVCLAVLAFCALGVWADVHAIRHVREDDLIEQKRFHEGLFSRLDTFRWQFDTQAEITGATNKILADALVRMRAQVKESTDKSAQTAKATVTIAQEATKQTAATTQVVQQLVTEPVKPMVTVEAPNTPPPVVNVEAPSPAPTPLHPPNSANTGASEQHPHHWWNHIWPWTRHGRSER